MKRRNPFDSQNYSRQIFQFIFTYDRCSDKIYMNLYIFRYQKGITPHIKSRKVRYLCAFPAFCLLFELYGSRRFRTHIIADSAHVPHLFKYPVRNPLQHIPVHPLNAGAHSIHSINSPDDHHIIKTPGIVLHSHRLKVRHHRKILPHLLIKPGLRELFPQDRVRLPHSFQPVPGNGP